MYKRKIIFLTPLIFFITMMIFFCPLNVRAEVSMSDIPEDAQSITLVWPDGSSETFNDHKAALGAADKEKFLETRTTDKDGTIILKDYIRSGQVRIYESKIPDGYTADTRNTTADLSEAGVKIVNHKAAAQTSHISSAPTGDGGSAVLWIAAGIGAAIVLVVLIKKRKAYWLIIIITAGVIGGAGICVNAAEDDQKALTQKTADFVISKVDQNDYPVKDALFEIYAKPSEVSWKESPKQAQNIVVLFTNDVHCGVDKYLGYATLSAYKKEMEAKGNAVLLVDDGDEVQGETIGAITKGEAIVNIMNAVGYDLATPGNHEFDYGMDRFSEIADSLDFPYVSCNFTDLRTGKLVFEPYKILEAGGKKIAFVGVTTPNSITSSTPKYFQDDNGNFIYGFCDGENGENLYNAVQTAVDSARYEGADYCVLLSHLGINAIDSPYMSTDVITHTTGIDAVLDGHSHSVVEAEKVKNAAGRDVLLSQAGYQLPYIGKLTIDPAGNMKTELIGDYEKKDDEITRVIEDEKKKFSALIEKKVGSTDHDLMAYDEDNKVWLVRNNETNLGDLAADAYKYVSGAEVAFINGGGLRNNILKGEIRYGNLLDVNPFGNTICSRKVTGKELSVALEYSVYSYPDLFGGFLQVSGITFDVDSSVPTPVVTDDSGNFVSLKDGPRRVSNIKINGEDIDPERTYTCASNSYIIKEKGNGYTMFNGDVLDPERIITDADALGEYLKHLGGVVPARYGEISGEGRINIK